MAGESLLTRGPLPRGQGREDAGFGASHGQGAGTPVLVPVAVSEQRREMPRRSASPSLSGGTVVFTGRDARAAMLLGHDGSVPHPKAAQTQPRWGLCSTLGWVLGQSNESRCQ